MTDTATDHRFTRLAEGLLAALLLLAPLFRSGKTPLAALLLECLALAALVLLFWEPARLGRTLNRAEKIFLAVLVALPVVQLLPLPLSRLDLPGQADYYAVLKLVEGTGATRLSILPRETWTGLLILLLPIAVYLLCRSLQPGQLLRLMHLALVMAAVQAVLGLAQFGSGPESILYFGEEFASRSAQGTYTSRNNFVGLMYLALMVALALFMATLGRQRQRAAHHSLRERLVYLSTGRGHQAFLYGVLAVLFLLAVVFSRSRAGIAVTILGIILAAVAYSRRIGGDNVYGLTGTVVALGSAAALAIGLTPVLERFSALDPVENGRAQIFRGAIEGINQFFPFGSGVGTFRDVYPSFQALELAGFTINRAHNSYLEWVFGGGIVALLLILAGLALYILRWIRVYRDGDWRTFHFVQVGAGLGLLLMLVHDLVDYNLFVPANMVYFAFFAGVFWHPLEKAPTQTKASARIAPLLAQKPRPPAVLVPVAAYQPNPFDDPPPESKAAEPAEESSNVDEAPGTESAEPSAPVSPEAGAPPRQDSDPWDPWDP